MSDGRGCSAIAQRTDAAVLAGQLNDHRHEMNAAIVNEGGTVMKAVMRPAGLAFFGIVV